MSTVISSTCGSGVSTVMPTCGIGVSFVMLVTCGSVVSTVMLGALALLIGNMNEIMIGGCYAHCIVLVLCQQLLPIVSCLLIVSLIA